MSDLENIAADPAVSDLVRAAAQYLLDNPVFTAWRASSTADRLRAAPDDVHLTAGGIELFLEYNAAVRAVGLGFDTLDTAGDDDKPDGHVSWENLEAAAGDDLVACRPAGCRCVPRRHPMLGNDCPGTSEPTPTGRWAHGRGPAHRTGAGFTHGGLIALAVDQQAYASDPAAASRFVLTLPVADEYGDGGLSLFGPMRASSPWPTPR